MARKRGSLTSQLPATPCTPEMREQVAHLSQAASVSIAELQRIAIAFFLSNNETRTIIKDRISIDEKGA